MTSANRLVPLVAATAALLALFPGGTAFADAPAASEPVQPSVWTAKELRFVYSGFTTTYSCDGLRGKMRSVLLMLGARKDDLVVNESACAAGPGEPTTFPTVVIKMHVLQPAPAPPPGANAPPAVAAHWRLVDLTKHRDQLSAAGDCELTEQIRQRVLPLFTTRNLEFHSNCVPNQLQLGTVLRVEVLIADTPQPGTAPPGGAPRPTP